MRPFLGTALAILVVAAVALSIGRTDQRSEIPPPVELFEVAGGRPSTGSAATDGRADRARRAGVTDKRVERRRGRPRRTPPEAAPASEEHPDGAPAGDAEDD